MEQKQYFEQFDLTPEEMKLRILNCCQLDILFDDNIVSTTADLLSKLPFPDQSFDLALCFNILFVEEEKPAEDYRLSSVLELIRVASEVRIFPLVDKLSRPSQHLGPILQTLQQKGFGVELRQIKQAGDTGNALLRIWNESCLVKP